MSVRSADPVILVINADDFGMNRIETEAVCEALSKGRITSATVMANGDALAQAVGYIRGCSGCSFGAHLNLTQGAPVLGGSGAKLLVDASGRMSRRSFAALRPRTAVLRAVYAEWCAQVELLASRGIAVSHFDSHHHVHTEPFLFPVLKALQKRFGIRRVRISKNIYTGATPCGRLLQAQKAVYNMALRNLYATRTTSGFTDLFTFYEVARHGKLKHGTVEVMVHPHSKGSDAEDALLNSDWEHSLPFPVVRIPYHQV